MSGTTPDADEEQRKPEYSRSRRQLLAAMGGGGAGALVIPGVGAAEEGDRVRSPTLPEGVSETPDNEVTVLSAETREPTSSKSTLTQSSVVQASGETPVWMLDGTIDVPKLKKELGLTVKLYDWDDPICNYSIELSHGFYTASGERIDCRGSNSVGLDVTVATASLGLEPLTGTWVNKGIVVTGEVCGGYWPAEWCYDVGIEVEF